jgi:subtilisin family serine protease
VDYFLGRGLPRAARGRVRRLTVVLVGLILAAGFALGAQSAASQGDEEATAAPFSHLDIRAFGNAGSFKPLSLAGDRTVGVILKLKGDSVGQRQIEARRQGRELTKAERAAIREQLRNQQAPVADRIGALGGTVFERYQDAYNGLAVRIPLKSLPALADLPEVASLQPDRQVTLDNVAGVQYIRGNAAWADTGRTGTGQKIAVIDTGIDYFHANFGGSGNPADFANDNHTIIEPGSFPTAKVLGGRDFVGDAYDSSSDDPAKTIPHPDPDPADCNGHGSHTAGTAAGFGVLSTGATYGGPYNGTTYSNSFTVGPGVAPEASIYAYRVFGCEGSATDAIVVAALDQALEDGVDVVNMSLGSPFGRADAADSEASNTLAQNGIVIVASAGNSGPSGYITGSPAAATRALSVAAIDASSPTFPGANIALSSGSILAQLSNGPFQGDAGAALPSGSLQVVVLKEADGTVSLGCDASDYSGYSVSGKLVVVLRGVCARVHKAIVGQKQGAAAVAMINTGTGYPPFEGDITSDPDTGEQFHVTIPFFGVRGLLGSTPPSDGDTLVAGDGGSSSYTATTVPNPGYQVAASFTSGGPRNVDSAVKPEVIAPGVSVKSTAMGTGTQGTRMSGTSMAAPHTAGVAALVSQAHPSWSTEAIKAAIIDTSNATSSKILNYNPRVSGAGVLDAREAVDTVAYATTSGGSDTINFGYHALSAAYSQTIPVTLHNTSGSSLTYDLSVAAVGILGSTTNVSPSSLTVPAGGTASFDVTVSLSAAAVAALPAALASNFGAIQTVRGAVVATPTSSGTGVYSLRVPYILVPRGLSNVTAGPKSAYTRSSGGVQNATVPLSNPGIHAGTADVYAWGIHDNDDISGGEDSMDVRDVGVQVQPKSFLCGTVTSGVCSAADDRSLIFSINVYGQAANPAVSEFDVLIDLQNDGRPDFFVVGVDFGAVTAGTFDGRFASFIFDKDGNLVDLWVASAPMNGSTVELPTLASEIGLDPAVNSTRFNYAVNAFSIVPENLVDTTAAASFRSHQPPISSGQRIPLAPGGSATLDVSVDRGKFAGTPQLGWLVVALDDANGAAQADEVPVGSLLP